MYAYSFFIFTSFGWLIWAAFGSSCCSQKQPSCSQQQPSSKQAAGGCAAIRLSTELQPVERLDEACRTVGPNSAQQQLGAAEKGPAEHGH